MRQKWLICLTGLAAALLLAGQALAVVYPSPGFYLPASPDADGNYQIRWRSSATSGVTYVLEEATQSDYSNAAPVYTGTSTGIWLYGRAPGSYYYRVKATKAGDTDSAWRNAATPIVVSDPAMVQLTTPSSISYPTTDGDGKYKVIIYKSLTPDVTYVLEESKDGGAWSPVYSGTNNYTVLNGRASGSYAYRAKVTKAGMLDSAYKTPAKTCVVTIPNPLAGTSACLTCHNGGAGGSQGAAWAASRHANANAKPNAGTGSCGTCHNPVNDVINGVSVVGCESCHGTQGGLDHPNTVTIDTTAAVATCAKCHNNHNSVVNNIVTKVNAGKHAIAANTHNSASCNRCHSTEGNLDYRNGVAVRANAPSNASCVVCHDSHTAQLRDTQYTLCTSCHQTSAGWQHEGSWARNIMSTHNDDPTTGWIYNGSADVMVGANSKIEGYVLRTNTANPCRDCHGHEFLTETGNLTRTAFAGLNASGVPTNYYGYTKKANHELTLHTEWAQSGHAGGLLAQKYAAQEAYPKKNVIDGQGTILATGTYDYAIGMTTAVKAAGVDGTTGPAWEHYNWDRTGRAGCQKCHTATGAANFLENPTGYNQANNSFAHLANWSTNPANGSEQNEVLYCWGCHRSVETGAVRNAAGAMPAEYQTITDYRASTTSPKFTFPEVSSSDICLACHGGRTSGAGVASKTSFTNASFANSHYLAAGGVLFKSIGYEFLGTGRSYANSTSFKHDKLGTVVNGVPYNAATGTSGPCVACHLGVTRKDHTMELGGLNVGTCGTAGACHSTMTQTELDEEFEHYEDALFALAALLQEKGQPWSPSSPYFATGDWTATYTLGAYNATTKTYARTLNAGTSGTYNGELMMGAAFNLNMLLHEPGGYAHNRYYAKRLIFDSIDFVYNGALEPLTLVNGYYDGSDLAAALQHAVGLTYVDHDGVEQVYTQAQTDAVLAYLDRRPDATYPANPGVQRP
jgi:predicted CXXCH cytochrome family protein